MMKLVISFALLLMSSSILADASVQLQNADKSFLLNAPGTLSGVVKNNMRNQTHIPKSKAQGDRKVATPSTLRESKTGSQTASSTRFAPVPRFPPQEQPRYRYPQNNEPKIRQFGQFNGQNNPWFDRSLNSAEQQRNTPSHPITNPWQLGGMPPLTDMIDLPQGGGRSPYYGPGYGGYGQGSSLYPDYPDGIYRDTNPALMGFPSSGGFLPGFDGNNFPFPISPFGMF